jgi:hypothetical protein
MAQVDPQVQRIIDAAAPGVLDVVAAYERFESAYMVAARVESHNAITSSTTSARPSSR